MQRNTAGPIGETQYKPGTPERIIATIEAHRAIAEEALRRVGEEGQVVRTLKGDVIAHPSLKIHADASSAEAKFLERWAVTTLAYRPPKTN